jgi:hypothetical protein
MEPARKFKIIVNSKECGTCSGPTPSAVAKKVVKKLCGTSSKAVRFSLKECKRGCERVCGPYQGRMEKLDRPYKRDGKKITHRVVCGKVKKMRGGMDLDDVLDNDYVKKKETDKNIKIEICSTKGRRGVHSTYYVFLGNIILGDNNYYEYIIYAVGKTIIIYKVESLKKNNTNEITGLNYTEILEQTNIDSFKEIFNSLDKTEFFKELNKKIEIRKKNKNYTSHHDNLTELFKYFKSINNK